MAKNQIITTKDTKYKKVFFKVENSKKQSPNSATSAAEMQGKSQPTKAYGSNKVLIDYNHSPTKVQQNNQEPKGKIDKFSNYIDRVKNKMRTTSIVGDDNGVGTRRAAVSRRDSFNDKISHYINRAKLKIRTTTIVGRGDHI